MKKRREGGNLFIGGLRLYWASFRWASSLSLIHLKAQLNNSFYQLIFKNPLQIQLQIICNFILSNKFLEN